MTNLTDCQKFLQEELNKLPLKKWDFCKNESEETDKVSFSN